MEPSIRWPERPIFIEGNTGKYSNDHFGLLYMLAIFDKPAEREPLSNFIWLAAKQN